MESRFLYLPVDSKLSRKKTPSGASVSNLPDESLQKVKNASEMKDLRERINRLLESDEKQK